MNRYNIFYQVHKGLRAMLYETALLLQHTDFTNFDEAEQAIEQLQTVVELFDNTPIPKTHWCLMPYPI